MSVDVMRNPSFRTSVLRWYLLSETTPFALAGHIGPVLVQVDPAKYGRSVCEAWFTDSGWETDEGRDFNQDDIIAFAIPEAPGPDAPLNDASPAALADELDAMIDGSAVADLTRLQHIAVFLRSLTLVATAEEPAS